MIELLAKGVISGAIVVAASELAQRSSVWAAVLVSLPLTSILALAWLWQDTHDRGQVTSLSWAILWIVLPSVIFFVALPLLMRVGLHFWIAMPVACAIMAAGYAAYVQFLQWIGVDA